MAAYKPVVKRETGAEKTTTEKEEEFKEVEYNDGKTTTIRRIGSAKHVGMTMGILKIFLE